MNIHELEKMTGVTKQNIRFYEKKGLLCPARNENNNYREYTEADVERLRTIKILRKLNLPIEDIRKVFQREEALSVVMERHEKALSEKRRELDGCIRMCKNLQGTELEMFDSEKVLDSMEDIERQGGRFASILEDYKKAAQAEAKKKFSFMPDTMVQNPAEFTEALLQYANANDRELVITKEGMYPVFELDGVEYTAERTFGRFGAIVQCSMTHPQEADPEDVPERRKTIYRLFNRYGLAVLLLVFLVATRGRWGLLVGIVLVPYFLWMLKSR